MIGYLLEPDELMRILSKYRLRISLPLLCVLRSIGKVHRSQGTHLAFFYMLEQFLISKVDAPYLPKSGKKAAGVT